jgi:hypothetical protein
MPVPGYRDFGLSTCQTGVRPPSTYITRPVINDDSSGSRPCQGAVTAGVPPREGHGRKCQDGRCAWCQYGGSPHRRPLCTVREQPHQIGKLTRYPASRGTRGRDAEPGVAGGRRHLLATCGIVVAKKRSLCRTTSGWPDYRVACAAHSPFLVARCVPWRPGAYAADRRDLSSTLMMVSVIEMAWLIVQLTHLRGAIVHM